MNKCEHCGARWGFGDYQWIDVKSRLPEKDDDYLTYVMDNGCSYRMLVQRFYKTPKLIKGIYKDCLSHWGLQKWDDDIVIYWLPLPSTASISSTMETKED